MSIDFLRNRHERALINIKRHLRNIPKAQLPARPSSKAINLPIIRQHHRMHISARRMNQMIRPHGGNAPRNGLVRVAVLICRKRRRVRVSQLPAGPRAPRVQMAVVQHRNGVGFPAGDLVDLHLLEGEDELGLRLVGAAVFVLWHRGSVRVAQLSATAAAPGKKLAFFAERDGVGVSTSDLYNFYVCEELNDARGRLVRVAFNIGWQILH